jgi:hypothetical protein
MPRKIRRQLLLLGGALLLTACTSQAPTSTTPGPQGPTPAPEFVEYWQSHGGAATFGLPIEGASHEGTLVLQSFLNVELIYDPSAPQSEAVWLAPLGRRLGLAAPALPAPSGSDIRYFPSTGHILYTGFAQTYDELGGLTVAGAPIAEVEFGNGLIYQFFENLGLYREENAPPSEVHLLAYGLAAHRTSMDVVAIDLGFVLPPGLHMRPFGEFLDRYGGEAFFGRPLTDPYLGADEAIEQVFERAVLYAPPDLPGLTRLRPLGLRLGPADPPVPPASDRSGLFFPSSGHNVRWVFAEFYRTHEGELLLGLPLGEAVMQAEVLTQRFENAVLEYHFDLPSPFAVQLAPLGASLIGASTPTTAAPTPISGRPSPTPFGSQATVIVHTWVEYSVLPAGATQRIFIQATLSEGSPWGGVIPVVRVDGPRSSFYPEVPPLDANGYAELTLVVEDLLPGEIVNYEVAVAGEQGVGFAVGQFIAGFSGSAP